jgi:hypothetical protein
LEFSRLRSRCRQCRRRGGRPPTEAAGGGPQGMDGGNHTWHSGGDPETMFWISTCNSGSSGKSLSARGSTPFAMSSLPRTAFFASKLAAASSEEKILACETAHIRFSEGERYWNLEPPWGGPRYPGIYALPAPDLLLGADKTRSGGRGL